VRGLQRPPAAMAAAVRRGRPDPDGAAAFRAV